MSVKLKKRILVTAGVIGMITVVGFAEMTGANKHRVEMKKLDGQVQSLMKKTDNLKPFTMAEVKL